jgi:hypothetical protein
VTDDFVFGGDATDIPPGTYPAKLTGLTTKTSEAFGDFRAWAFTLDTGSVVGGGSSMATSSKSKGGKWAMALLGRKPAAGEKVELIGLPCLVVVTLDAKDWPKVTDVLPPLVKGATVAPAASQASPAGDGDGLPF